MSKTLGVVLVTLLHAAPMLAQATLLHEGNLVYEGSFLAPRGDQGCAGCRFGYPPMSGGGLWYDDASQTLWAAGHAQFGKVGQMTVPELRDARTQALLTAAAVQFGDATDGRYKSIGQLGGGEFTIGGIVKLGDRLCVNGYQVVFIVVRQPMSGEIE